jgi:hypothetical protein
MFLQPIFDILAWHDIGRLDRGRQEYSRGPARHKAGAGDGS